ncbi:hypothetical protein FLAG1_10601 [Fusarium langsethiae]|uniref:Uncharacterized protein n=1 Tax=Fusarium langsethiae TaxID=179993 RepID=A0A0M9ENG0_FUSLA|nr:hypothetical protein FLAG1_10601 [Fusarium langsethiae]GKU07246.1 unnamed protein product [Fusarium langsethiae]GKU21602.1 unnamed protein product [Fusarium langsethiae]
MCRTSAYFVRCNTCKEDIDHHLEVDSPCKNKIRGLPYCSQILPVNMGNVEWVDMSHCLPCTAKRDMLDSRIQATIDQEAKEKLEQPEEKSDSDDELIMKQLIADVNGLMNQEKRGRVNNWLEELPNVRVGETFDEGESERPIRAERGRGGRGPGRGRGRGRGN